MIRRNPVAGLLIALTLTAGAALATGGDLPELERLAPETAAAEIAASRGVVMLDVYAEF